MSGNPTAEAVKLIADVLEEDRKAWTLQGEQLARIEKGQADILKAIGELFKSRDEQAADLEQLQGGGLVQLRKTQ